MRVTVRPWILTLILLGTLLVTLPAITAAAIISPGRWVAPSTTTPNHDGTPWYDQPSEDCSTCSASWPIALLGVDGVLTYADGPAPFYVTGLNGLFQMGPEIADWRDQNQFGWFQIGAPDWGTIFYGSASTGDFATAFPMPAQAGFWFLNARGDLFTTTKDPGQFVLTRTLVNPYLTQYMLQIEDQRCGKAGQPPCDRNDMRVYFYEVTVPPVDTEIPTVPEPTSLVHLGTGVLAGVRKVRGRVRREAC